MKPISKLCLASLISFAMVGAAAAATMNANQAAAYIATARITSEGAWEGKNALVAVVPGPKNSWKLEVWGKAGDGYTLLASAPSAGCMDCSGPSRKPNPSKAWFSDGTLNVEYQGGGSGAGFWAWRSTWGTDPVMGGARALATQRIGADGHSDTRHALVNFVDGTRMERTMLDGSIKTLACRAAIAKLPAFSDLSLSALFDGTLEPECLSGTETGDPLGSAPALGSGNLDLMRRSSPKQ